MAQATIASVDWHELRQGLGNPAILETVAAARMVIQPPDEEKPFSRLAKVPDHERRDFD
jgi:hypothetical protein